VAVAAYQDLCVDVVDADAMAAFWVPALGLVEGRRWPHVVRLDGPTPQHTVWLNVVPERPTVKNRVHLDVWAASPDLPGATPVADRAEDPWTVLADPDGNELCVFVRDPAPGYRLYEVVVDAADARSAAAWWGEVLGVPAGGDDGCSLQDAPGMPFELVFQDVPEPKTVKNRVHWDVRLEQADGVQRLVSLGARVLREPDDDVRWTVMADPEGNEFCAFAPDSATP
jgi:catechol 2,3-dioxygenase-like lactoylglutathione lyase family enzyme